MYQSAIATLIAVLCLGTSDAIAARVLVAELLARPPAAAGEPSMSALALEACLTRAIALDHTGLAVDGKVVAVDRLAAEGMFLQNQLDAEMPALNGYDEEALKDFQRRVIRHEDVAQKFRNDFAAYQKEQRSYDDAIAEFERDCSQRFSAADLATVKAKLGLK